MTGPDSLSRQARCWTPICANPQELAQHCFVAVIGGRDLRVQNLVGLDDIYYAGSHGFDIAS
jgi:trehalose-6-phosphatase